MARVIRTPVSVGDTWTPVMVVEAALADWVARATKALPTKQLLNPNRRFTAHSLVTNIGVMNGDRGVEVGVIPLRQGPLLRQGLPLHPLPLQRGAVAAALEFEWDRRRAPTPLG